MSCSAVEQRSSDTCPLSGDRGRPLRIRKGVELANCYESYFGNALPSSMISSYFPSSVQEFHSSVSDLRWFSPARVAGEDFYQLMAATYPWYYSPSTWDKHYSLSLLRKLGISRFVEVGCGDGIFLEMAKRIGVQGVGVDTNQKALERVASKGLNAVLPDELTSEHGAVDALVMLQVLEHVPEPLEFTKHYVELLQPEKLVIAVPCHESLLSHVSDPLAWPPHHVTMWSKRSFDYLGERLGYHVSHCAYPSMSYQRFVQLFNLESNHETPLGPLRKRRGNPGAVDPIPDDFVARLIRKVEDIDGLVRQRNQNGLTAKVLKSLYRKGLRPFDEPRDVSYVGPRFGRAKWLYQCALQRPWALRDFWVLVVMDRRH